MFIQLALGFRAEYLEKCTLISGLLCTGLNCITAVLGSYSTDVVTLVRCDNIGAK